MYGHCIVFLYVVILLPVILRMRYPDFISLVHCKIIGLLNSVITSLTNIITKYYIWRRGCLRVAESPGPTIPYLAPVGSVAAFKPDSEHIDSFLEKVELYMAANNFPE